MIKVGLKINTFGEFVYKKRVCRHVYMTEQEDGKINKPRN